MFVLPKLPYSYKALEPFINKETMTIHHTKHHQGYVNKLNETLKNHPKLLKMEVNKLLSSISKLPKNIQQPIINNAGGHANHTDFWQNLTPANQSKFPSQGILSESIKSTFGDFENFKERFFEKAMSVFGSGWIFLITTNDNKLKLKRNSFQNSPILDGNFPLLGLDLWEHAYYIQYRWNRAEYIKRWFNVINWDQVEKNLLQGGKQLKHL